VINVAGGIQQLGSRSVMNMTIFDKRRAQIAVLCDKAIEGELLIEDLCRQWPKELDESRLASMIYEDIEDGVEHFPGKLFCGKPVYKNWKSSDSFVKLYLDKKLLALDGNEEYLLGIRETLLRGKQISIEMIDAKLDTEKPKE
jgi:hypothetical protein